jgi:phosphonatase-like hydrolase
MTVQLVVFDIAGTTLQDDNKVGLALQFAFAKENLAIAIASANAVMGYPKPISITMLLENEFNQKLNPNDPLVQKIHDTFLAEIVNFYQTTAELKEKEGTIKIFDCLRAHRIKVFLDTGFDRLTTDTILNRMQWRSHLDGSVSSDEVINGRPFPDLIYRAMELSGVTEVSAVAKVGDTPSDLEEGTAAGCGFVIGVTTGATSPQILANSPHTHLIKSLIELPTILGIQCH